MNAQQLETTVCVVGGGPAGVVLALLLARAGVDVTVLEKHKDFNRDFRGDTIHSATLRVMHQLGLLNDLLRIPHRSFDHADLMIGNATYTIADLTTLPAPTNFVALMPQWDLLNFLASEVRKFPNGKVLMEHNVTGLLADPANSGRTVGARAETPSGTVEVRAALTVGCDGRHAVTTEAAHLEYVNLGAPIDVLWLRMSRREDDPDNALGNVNYGGLLVLINRGDYFQCGYVIKKDSFETQIKPACLPAFRDTIVKIVPFLGVPGPDGKSRVDEITSWDQVSLLSVQVNRLTRWHRDGLLCIGDAAHAMSPVGGIGINLAIQDAVAAARILRERLRVAGKSGQIAESALAEVQGRREFPTKVTQSFQIKVHGFLKKYLGNPGPAHAPGILRFLSNRKIFRMLTARFIALGVRPESVD